MFPDKEVISYSDNLLGVTPLYSVFRIIGFNYLTAFQLLIILCHTLNFLFCFYCFHKLTGNKYAAACGAFIFAFSIALNGMYNHPQYTFRFCIPLFFYFLINYLNTYQLKSLLLSFLFLILQFYLGIYLGYFVLVIGAFFSFFYFMFNAPNIQKIKKAIPHAVIAIPFFFICLLPLFYFYYKRNQTSGYYTDYNFYMETIPRLSSYVKSFPGSISWSFLNNTNVSSQYEWLHILFPGALIFTAIFLSMYLAFKNHKRNLYLSVLALIIVFIMFTINYNEHTLYGYLMKIPGIKAARVVSRFVTVLIFFGAWLVCLNVDYFQNNFLKYKNVIIVLLPLLLLADNYCTPTGFKTFTKEECITRVDNIKKQILLNPNYKNYKAFAYIPSIKLNSQFYHIDAMLCALSLKSKTINGYSSSCHKDFGPFWRNIDSTSLSDWCKTIKLDINSVLIVK